MDDKRRKELASSTNARQLIIGTYAGLEGLIEILEKSNGQTAVQIDSVVALLRPLAAQLGDVMDQVES